MVAGRALRRACDALAYGPRSAHRDVARALKLMRWPGRQYGPESSRGPIRYRLLAQVIEFSGAVVALGEATRRQGLGVGEPLVQTRLPREHSGCVRPAHPGSGS